MSQYSILVDGLERPAFLIDPPEVEGYIIGRSDEASKYVPDIDLANYEAREKGVSRRHAALVTYQGAAHVVDLNSINGTFLNGKRLSPDMPYALKESCEIRLGTLKLTITLR